MSHHNDQKISQTVEFNTTTAHLYETMVKADQFGKVTNSRVEINNEPGGALSLFDGMITGQTVELVPNKRIIQVWRAGNWPAGTYSLVKFEFVQAADGHTVLHFEQIGFPEDQREHLETGWKNKYWDPLKAYLG